jgi:small subunit ribosomal protein S6
MYIVRPEVTDEELQVLMGRVADTIGQIGGTIDLHEVWERRELAYEIDGCKRGTYVICYFNAESTAIDAVRHEMDLEEPVLRYVATVANPRAIWRPVGAAEAAAAEAAPAETAEAAEGEAEAEATTEPAPEAAEESSEESAE